MKIDTKFDIQDKVLIDGDKSLIGTVIAIQVHSDTMYDYQLSWLSNGAHFKETFDEWRLTKWEG